MMDLDRELWRLGIPAKTRHNEVAPGQFEMAPVFEADLRRVRPQHDRDERRCAGSPRSTASCSSSTRSRSPASTARASTTTGRWRPTTARTCSTRATTRTRTPSSWRSCMAVIRGVNVHADLLRASIADAGKDHRLGANEAPPAIMSIFLGSQLEDVIDQLEQGAASASKQRRPRRAGRDLAAGPAQGRDGPQPDLAVRLHRQQVRVPRGRLVRADLLAADGPQHRGRRLALAARRRAREAQATATSTGLTTILSGIVRDQQAGPVRGQRLLRGVARRGRPPRAAEQPDHRRRAAGADDAEGRSRCSRSSACSPSASSLARAEINWERYVKVQNIEANCALDIARTMILPATARYLGQLASASPSGSRGIAAVTEKVASLADALVDAIHALEHAQHAAHEAGSVHDEAAAFVDEVIPAQNALRAVADELETLVVRRPLAAAEVPRAAVPVLITGPARQERPGSAPGVPCVSRSPSGIGWRGFVASSGGRGTSRPGKVPRGAVPRPDPRRSRGLTTAPRPARPARARADGPASREARGRRQPRGRRRRPPIARDSPVAREARGRRQPRVPCVERIPRRASWTYLPGRGSPWEGPHASLGCRPSETASGAPHPRISAGAGVRVILLGLH